MSNPNTRKSCIVTMCRNTTINAPQKLFFIVPSDEKTRRKWLECMKRSTSVSDKSTVYCCEDHFDVEEDMENYIKFKLMGGQLRLKKGVLPHKFGDNNTQSTPNMDNEMVERIIEKVRRHRFLYDPSHPEYKKIAVKSVVWESIGKELNVSDEYVRNKWKTVRDGYTKYKKLLKSSTASDTRHLSYVWASKLEFLDKFSTKRTKANTAHSSTNFDHIQVPYEDTDSLTFENDLSPSTSASPTVLVPSTSSEMPIELSHSTRLIKRSADSMKDDDIEPTKKKRKDLDFIDNLFLSYADTFKRFPAREQIMVKLEMAKLFANTELSLLNSESLCQMTSISSSQSKACSRGIRMSMDLSDDEKREVGIIEIKREPSEETQCDPIKCENEDNDDDK